MVINRSMLRGLPRLDEHVRVWCTQCHRRGWVAMINWDPANEQMQTIGPGTGGLLTSAIEVKLCDCVEAHIVPLVRGLSTEKRLQKAGEVRRGVWAEAASFYTWGSYLFLEVMSREDLIRYMDAGQALLLAQATERGNE